MVCCSVSLGDDCLVTRLFSFRDGARLLIGCGGNYWLVLPNGTLTDGNRIAARHFYKGELDVDEITPREAEVLALNVTGKSLNAICAAILSSAGRVPTSGVDRARIHAAFETLRNEGFTARMDWGADLASGYAALPHPPAGIAPRIVFFHKQDAEAFDALGNLSDALWLAHAASTSDVHRIVEVLNAHGVVAHWDGDHAHRIKVVSIASVAPLYAPDHGKERPTNEDRGFVLDDAESERAVESAEIPPFYRSG